MKYNTEIRSFCMRYCKQVVQNFVLRNSASNCRTATYYNASKSKQNTFVHNQNTCMYSYVHTQIII